jgi:hypothetical protein
MTVVARRILSTPVRTASQTWGVIAHLVAAPGTDAYREVVAITGVAAALIASEALGSDPLTIIGAGPRVRVYCLYGEDAMSADDKSEEAFVRYPTDGEWKMSLPCPPDDLIWVQGELERISGRISARKLGEPVEDSDAELGKIQRPEVDANAFLKP